MPVLRALVLMLGLCQLVGVADIVFGDTCEESCEDETDCLPGTSCCRCHASVMVAAATEKIVTKIEARTASVCFTEREAHQSPDPREILHVPRRAA